MDTATRAIAEDLLLMLRRLHQADDRKLARVPGPYGHARHALIAVMGFAGWGAAQANEAISQAMLDGSKLVDAMLATQRGGGNELDPLVSFAAAEGRCLHKDAAGKPSGEIACPACETTFRTWKHVHADVEEIQELYAYLLKP